MFHAAQISLGEGQSYENCQVFSHQDILDRGYPAPFESRTMAFRCCEVLYVVHVWNIISIKLDKFQVGGPGFFADRIVINGDANYDNVLVLEESNWLEQGIPYVLKTDDGITAQMVFSCSEGTFIILDQSVTSIAIRSPRPTIREATQIINSPATSIKKAGIPQTINGRITH